MFLLPAIAMVSNSKRIISITMSSFKLVFLCVFICFLNLSTATAQQPIFLNASCSINENFTENSAYQVDRSILLSSLSSNATGTTEFFNTTVSGRGNSDRIYGLFMCRGDVFPQLCQKCVLNATQQIASRCPNSKEAIIWYDECLLRYSNRSFFSTVDVRPRFTLWNTVKVSNPQNFMRLLFNIMNETADEAAYHSIGLKKYATKQPNISVYQTLYCLAQCTPDLSPQDCRRCLSGVIGDLPWCCMGTQGGRVLYPSCNVRYEFYAFYRSAALPPAATPEGLVPPTTSAPSKGRRKMGWRLLLLVIFIPVAVLLMLFCLGCYFLRRKARKSQETILRENFGDGSASLESLQFDLATIEAATNKFSSKNRIGKGGFGEVYKGILLDGREIAVKRLSASSMQGAIEFKNEILLIAKLQHRNLVALLGFCLEGKEKILVYEYVPNKSLDYFLFDSRNQRLLSWYERFKIIKEIVQAILYLHEHSRLKVIHRDLKPGNILLDNNMNPKISDFGMAKMVALDQDKGSTTRIVGTYGYMSPEYAMLGQFSEKSDIYSFGVIVLEIISGKKNANSYESEEVVGLLNYAWRNWKDQTPSNILDPNLRDSYLEPEVIRCIEIGLLCVQENPDDRLTMAMVHSYLNNLSIELPFPREPAFYMHGRMEPDMLVVSLGQSANNAILSVDEMSINDSFPR